MKNRFKVGWKFDYTKLQFFIFGIFVFLIDLSFLSNQSFCQKPKIINTAIAVKNPESKSIIDFSTQFYDGRVYLKWLVLEQKQNCLFIILRSEDGESFEVIEMKRGYGTSAIVPILYCFVDSFPPERKVYYKVQTWISEDLKNKVTEPVLAKKNNTTDLKTKSSNIDSELNKVNENNDIDSTLFEKIKN